jgi:predicted TPR repeat methyltransferase
MINKDNRYTKMQSRFFDDAAENMSRGNHREHDSNPDYHGVLLGDLNDDDVNGLQVALDFGCGCGRNIDNLLKGWNWKRVDGVDISLNIIQKADEFLSKTHKGRYKLYVNNGVDLDVLSSGEYDFVMSTIVFQHICVHEIRCSLMSDIHRVMKDGGLFSFQMGFGFKEGVSTVGYHENYYDATSTNSGCDTRVEDPDQIVSDLEKIGFKNVRTVIRPSWSCNNHDQWIYIKATKKTL